MQYLAVAICMALSTFFPAISQGKVGAAAMEGIARQPEAGSKIQTAMIIAMAMSEALTIYGLLIAIMLLGKF